MRASRAALAVFAILLAACGDDGSAGAPKADAAAECEPKNCSDFKGRCGSLDDGCGGELKCPCDGLACKPGSEDCDCSPLTCDAAGADCGTTLDGCTGRIACGECPGSQTCGAGGPNRCGRGSCTKIECDGRCGELSNGCDDVLQCGLCPSGEQCVNNRCEACSGDACETATTCSPETYLIDCPAMPCGTLRGCEAGTCAYEDYVCPSSGICPVFSCRATPLTGGDGKTYYSNECVAEEDAVCIDPEFPNTPGKCVGVKCIVPGRRELVDVRIEPIAVPSGGWTSVSGRAIVESSLTVPAHCTEDDTGRSCRAWTCNDDETRCVMGGLAP